MNVKLSIFFPQTLDRRPDFHQGIGVRDTVHLQIDLLFPLIQFLRDAIQVV
jgi:hypothetical protein